MLQLELEFPRTVALKQSKREAPWPEVTDLNPEPKPEQFRFVFTNEKKKS